ncbi:AMP deaminase, partial [Linderina macrospora]
MADHDHHFEDDTPEPTYLQGDDHHSDEEDTKSSTHPFVTYNSLASSKVEAGPSFVNAYFAKHQHAPDPLTAPPGTQTPDVRGMSPSTGAGPAAAAMIKCRQGFESNSEQTQQPAEQLASTTPLSIRVSQQMKEEHKDTVVPQLSRATTSTRIRAISDASDTANNTGGSITQIPEMEIDERVSSILDDSGNDIANADLDVDDDTTSRKIEDEIRSMMRKVHIQDITDGTNGMGEGPQELKRIGDTLAKCMELRDKYMDISCQHEVENPKNKPDWAIYPKPPPPAWHNFSHKSASDPPEEFDLAKCKIPSAGEAVFEMGEDGIYSVYSSEEL